MATQDDVTILKADLDAIKAGIAAQSDTIASLTSKLAVAQQASPVDLSDIIAEANSLADGFRALTGTTVTPAQPTADVVADPAATDPPVDPTPTPEPVATDPAPTDTPPADPTPSV